MIIFQKRASSRMIAVEPSQIESVTEESFGCEIRTKSGDNHRVSGTIDECLAKIAAASERPPLDVSTETEPPATIPIHKTS